MELWCWLWRHPKEQAVAAELWRVRRQTHTLRPADSQQCRSCRNQHQLAQLQLKVILSLLAARRETLPVHLAAERSVISKPDAPGARGLVGHGPLIQPDLLEVRLDMVDGQPGHRHEHQDAFRRSALWAAQLRDRVHEARVQLGRPPQPQLGRVA